MERRSLCPCPRMVSSPPSQHALGVSRAGAEFGVLKKRVILREIYDLTTNSVACTFCSTPFSDPSSALIVKCPHSTSSVYCPARFCNRLCLTRGNKISHTLLCPARNPKTRELFQFIRVNHWMALHALVQCSTRLLLSGTAPNPKQPEPSLDEEWVVFNSFASLSLADREAW
jgi:hypothetical protein